MLVSNNFDSSAQIDINGTWLEIETTYPFKKYVKDTICILFSTGRWNKLNICAFLTVEYLNPENLVFQHLLVKGKIKNPYKNNRLEEINKMRNGV